MSQNLIHQRNQIVTAMEKMIADSEAANKPFTNEQRQSYEAMRDDVKSLTSTINAATETQRIAAELSQVNSKVQKGAAQFDAKAEENATYRDAFNAYARHMDSPEIRNALNSRKVVTDVSAKAQVGNRFQNAAQTTTTTGGGYLIPVELSNQIEVRMKYFGGMLQAAETFSTSGGYVFNYPTLDDTSNTAEAHSINGAVNNIALSFGNIPFSAFTYDTGSILVPFELLEDSAFDLDKLISEAFAIRLGRKLNTKLTLGSGSGEPTGLITALTANSNTVNGSQAASAVTSSGFPVLYKDLVALKHSVDKAYRDMPGVGWMANDSIYEALELLVDSNNRPLIRSSLEGFGNITDVTETILGKKIFTNNDMAGYTQGAAGTAISSQMILVFGDLTKYKIREIADNSGSKFSMLRLNELYAANLQKGFIGWKRIDGQLVVGGSGSPAAIVGLVGQ